MAKFHGMIGFAKAVKTSGIYEDVITERPYYGEVLQDHATWNSSDKVLDDIDISNRFRIMADSYLLENLGAMKYVKYKGIAWKIKSFDPAYPRITLLVGGVYNGPQTESAG